MKKITACIITFNEEKNIGQCLKSLSFCDEIIVVDSHSTDGTRVIAKNMGAKVIERDWPGYKTQRKFAIETSRNNWIIMLDADEWLSLGIAEEIQFMLKDSKNEKYSAYYSRRTSYYLKRKIRFGDWGQDRVIRLFDRTSCDVIGMEVHEKIHSRGRIGHLRNPIFHNPYHSLENQLFKLNNYAEIWANESHYIGRKGNLSQLLFNPLWRFFRSYIFRLGFLDGERGLLICLMEANYTLTKYLKLLAKKPRYRQDNELRGHN